MTSLETFCEKSLARSVAEELHEMASILQAKHPQAVAIIAYGSCLRNTSVRETLMDFYVLTENFGGVSSSLMSQGACALIPPNVYYAETQDGLRAKYAVLPLQQFKAWMAPRTNNPYFWARFSQPSALLYLKNEAVKDEIVTAIATALRTTFANGLSLTNARDAPTVWASVFKSTYATEFRPESAGRASEIVEAHLDYYQQASAMMGDVTPVRANQTIRRLQGKLWSIARLVKASFTFRGGASYLAWKIERHTGEKIILSDWQKRHPVIAGMMLIGPLLRKGAIR